MTAVINMVPDGQWPATELDKLIHALETRILETHEVMRIEHAADFLRISRAQIDRMCKDGQLPFHKLEGLGGKVFLRSELIDYIKKS
jgi:excisionase family DNA binding protein